MKEVSRVADFVLTRIVPRQVADACASAPFCTQTRCTEYKCDGGNNSCRTDRGFYRRYYYRATGTCTPWSLQGCC